MSKSAAKLQHENFEITNISNRVHIIRQDRIDMQDFDCTIELNKAKWSVVNLSPFGAQILGEGTAPEEGSTHKIKLLLEGLMLGDFEVKIVRVANKLDNIKNIALEIIGNSISLHKIHAIEKALTIKMEMMNDLARYQTVPHDFKKQVYEIKSFLQSLQSKIEVMQPQIMQNDLQVMSESEDAIVQTIGSFLDQVMPVKNETLQKYFKDLNSDEIKICYEFFRETLKELIYQSPFASRVYNKPLGYAGDFEMMNLIYKNENAGSSLFAKCLNNFWVRQPAAQAVRNRADYLVGKILHAHKHFEGKGGNFLSVAAGPALEWQILLQDKLLQNSEYNVELLDQDTFALKHAQKKLKEMSLDFKSKINFKYTNLAIKNVISQGLEKNKYDLIYSAGLFDYFSDPVAEMAARKLYESLKPEGQLIIGNFNVTNPNSIMMGLGLDWNLIYRSNEDMHRLFGKIGTESKLEEEGLGINLFYIIKK